MKRKILCSGVFLLTVFIVSAQKKNTNGFIELTVGASFPLSKFADGEAGNHIEGFAKTGEAITISYHHPSKSKIGLMLMLFGERNPLNVGELEKTYSNVPFYSMVISPVPNPPLPSPVYYKNWKFNKEAWYTLSLMGGAYTNLSFNEERKFFFSMKALIGVAYAASPQYRGVSHSDTAIVSILQQKNHAFGFSYSFAPALQYVLKPGTNLSLNYQYFGTANLSFDKMKTTSSGEITSGGGPSSSWMQMYTGNVKQAVQTMNLQIGIHFEL